MRANLLSVVAAILLLATSPVRATLIYYGIFSGTVISSTGPDAAQFPVGTPVTGTFSYDHDLLFVNSFGQLQTLLNDPACSFLVNIGGYTFGYPADSSLTFTVGANGLPISGNANGWWDLSFGNGYIGLVEMGLTSYVDSQVTYSISSIPDAGASSILLGIALASVAVTRRFFRQI